MDGLQNGEFSKFKNLFQNSRDSRLYANIVGMKESSEEDTAEALVSKQKES